MGIRTMLKETLPPAMLEPLRRVYDDVHYAAMHVVPEEWYLKRQFEKLVGYPLNLDNPRTFNEKLQWLKLHDRNPLYTKMVDKYEAKKYVAEIIGEEYIIPTLGVWEHFDEIDFDTLPQQFVLKCTHDSGSIVICKDKDKLDKKAAREKLERGLRYNYYYRGGFEWPYKNVKPRIIAEKFMVDESRTELKDYKVFNFNGEPKIIQVDYDRFVEHKRDLYSADWEKLEYALMYAMNSGHEVNRPQKLAEMLDLACKLAEKHPFLRTDFYSIDDKLYFGEMTFYPEAGFGKWTPEEIDEKLGNCVNIQGGGAVADR
ncbi:TupA-like ATPgrasp [Selenomonas sp. WCT3]|uniref:ATP-grasp fold amidoligase family protein n=1 Tax=Selenomonas sp. WCT3 TaxID=3158785 RepID=UPI00088C6271|nr:TupA-like ATPgrasp [Selenomonas ruminantium]